MTDQTTPAEPTVSQMMRTDVPTIAPTMEIGDLARLLSDEHMSSVAVVDNGKLVGMVGQSDLIFQEIEDDVEMPHTIPILGGVIFLERMDHWREKFRKAFGVTAADLMTSEPISVAPGDSVHEAASQMIKHDVNRLPVVDDAGAVVGVISRADVVRALAEEW
jgi:CBS domain-containing protein